MKLKGKGDDKLKFLTGGGEMGEQIRAFDWSTTAVGPIDQWPQSLKTAVSLLLNSGFPTFIWWGQSKYVYFYNDAYLPILGDKKEGALGGSGKDIWNEIWDDISPMVDQIFETGKPVFLKNMPLNLLRYGYEEVAYFTFSYGSVRDEAGNIGGLYCVVTETTDEVISKRELAESEERFRTMAAASEILIGVADENSNATYFNEAWTKMTGRPVKELLERGWIDLLHPNDAQPFFEKVMEAVRNQQSFSGELRVMCADGKYHWFYTKAPARFRPDGSFAGHISSSVDITESKEALLGQQRLKSITDERNALARVNKTKDEFIALASHQLRTPATAVKQYIGLLLDDFAGPVTLQQRQFLQTAYDSNERQLKIINDILKTAQLDSNRYTLHHEEHNIVKVVQESIAELQTMFVAKTQTVVLKSANEPLLLKFDEIEIKLVMINLLENASKYSYENTVISVVIIEGNNTVSISVTDSGVGIDKTNYSRIFDKFTRIDNRLSDTVTGTGLGLYWSKRIIKLHNGSIKVTSVPGESSTFTVRLPL